MLEPMATDARVVESRAREVRSGAVATEDWETVRARLVDRWRRALKARTHPWRHPFASWRLLRVTWRAPALILMASLA